MLHHLTIETDREVDSAELLDFMLTECAMFAPEIVGGHVDRDAAAAERAIAKRDRAIRLLISEVIGSAWVKSDALLDYLATLPGFPAEVVDTIRHVCGIDAPVEVES